MDKRYLLILDDSYSDVELVYLELKNSGNYQLDHAKNHAEFFDFYNSKEYTAIISDYHVPGESTLDILKEVRAINKLIPYIFVSGVVGDEQAVGLLKTGATDYILKDNIQKLPFTLNRAIKEREMAVAEEKALLALVENEKKFRSILQNAPDATLLVDEKGEIQFANKQATKLFGYQPHEFILIKLENLIPERYRDKEQLKSANNTKNTTDRRMGVGQNLYGLKKNGTEFPTDISISLISEDESGKTLRIYSIRDVTSRKKEEEEILKNTELLNEAQKLAKVGSWEWNLSTNKVDWSDELYNIVGLENDGKKVKFERLFDFMHPEDRATLILASKNKIKSESKFSPQFRITTPSGEFKHLKSIENQTYDENGKLVVINGTIQDVTESVNAEIEKREIQRKALETVEEEVKLRTLELFEANHFLKLKNDEIRDSINYAKFIQFAILNNEDDCMKIFLDSFVLWMPKDGVSGDFFWCYSDDRYDFLAVADCTGHGVPGAFMSIISIQKIRKVVESRGIKQPKDILNFVNKGIVASMKQKTGMLNDGMDIGIIRIDKQNNTLIFAGAQRPLLLFDGEKLIVIDGNKEGIGGYLSEGSTKEFSEIEIKYKKGDIVYLTSDGYCSQFGGEKGKKIMTKKMQSLILSNANDPLNVQKEKLSAFFKEWMGSEEQVDDVLMIGVKL